MGSIQIKKKQIQSNQMDDDSKEPQEQDYYGASSTVKCNRYLSFYGGTYLKFRMIRSKEGT